MQREIDHSNKLYPKIQKHVPLIMPNMRYKGVQTFEKIRENYFILQLNISVGFNVARTLKKTVYYNYYKITHFIVGIK